mmetsp:Transcript_12423/g.12509  ORF Transcript_12423/g.12509 Transcript_12423/m.12509 type:complete len:235 (+) Transcript_12423:110-814(+)
MRLYYHTFILCLFCFKYKSYATTAIHSFIPGSDKRLMLTFDDGPDLKWTPLLLDLLKMKGIKATFFLVGKNASDYPDLVKRMIDEGHEVANHTWNHVDITKLTPEILNEELSKTNSLIYEISQYTPKTFRPPYGNTNPRLNDKITKDFSMRVIKWSIDSLDWRGHTAEHIQKTVTQAVKTGDILLFHEGKQNTMKMLPNFLDDMISQGYLFVTAIEMLSHLDPSKTRSRSLRGS